MSHISGLLKFTQRPRWFGYGRMKYDFHMRPTWMPRKSAAVSTANTVIASAPRLMALRHLARNR